MRAATEPHLSARRAQEGEQELVEPPLFPMSAVGLEPVHRSEARVTCVVPKGMSQRKSRFKQFPS